MAYKSPVYHVIPVPIEKVRPNTYNPNAVAPPEMRLLYESIRADGYTMPIVCYYAKSQDIYVIVDGFHRYRVMLEHPDIYEREGGVLPVSAPQYRGSGERAALQFAVSWNAAAIPDILDILKDKSVKATFAVSGEWAENNPALLMRMAAEGHEIASMGYYPDMDGRIGWTVKDVRRANEAVKKICGAEPAIYYEGSRNTVTSTLAAKKLKLTAVSSTIDLLTAKGTAADILSRLPEKPIEGSIILLRPTAACKEALGGIINAIEEKGIGLTCTGDVLGLSE